MKICSQYSTCFILALAALSFNFQLIEAAHAREFSSISPMITARESHTATLLNDGRVLIVGGDNMDDLNENTSSPEIFDPATTTWTTTLTWTSTQTTTLINTLCSARVGHTATLLFNGQVLVAGGAADIDLFDLAELYDPSNGTWKKTGTLKAARSFHTATLLRNGKVLIAGGTALPLGYETSSAELYDPATGKWTETGAMSIGREHQTATLLPNGKVLVTGGLISDLRATRSPDGKIITTGGNRQLWDAGAELYDPVTGHWTKTASMHIMRSHHTATLLPNGKVLVVGGFQSKEAELYDPNSGTWTLTGAMQTIRTDHTATLLANGKVLVAGGLEPNALNSVEIYDPTTGNWTEADNMNAGRAFQTATVLPDGKVLFAGGTQTGVSQYPHGNHARNSFLASAEIFDPETAKTNNNSVVVSVSRKPDSVVPINVANPALASNVFSFTFLNTSKTTFTILATTNISLALSNWTDIGNAIEISPGVFQFTDLEATNYSQRFYRVRSP